MDPEHRSILQAKSCDIAKTISVVDLKKLLLDYKIFNKYMWIDINSTSDVFDLLPSRGPKAFQTFIKILRETNYDQEADILENTAVSNLPKTKRYYTRYYTLSSEPLGYCLVINNVKFDVSEDRYGSNVDAENIKTLFKKIGFDVTVETNLKAAEMYECIEKFSKSDFELTDSAIVIILSHGTQHSNQDFICGTDDKDGAILKKDIINMFSNKNCRKLQGKPKIFFFIACRGGHKDYGETKFYPHESIDATSDTEIIPTFTDIFIVHSSLPGDVSVRDHEKGSWFCQDFLDVLNDSYNKYDLEEILKDVNIKMSKRISKQHRNVQVIHTENYGWMKGIMLCKWSHIVQL